MMCRREVRFVTASIFNLFGGRFVFVYQCFIIILIMNYKLAWIFQPARLQKQIVAFMFSNFHLNVDVIEPRIYMSIHWSINSQIRHYRLVFQFCQQSHFVVIEHFIDLIQSWKFLFDQVQFHHVQKFENNITLVILWWMFWFLATLSRWNE